MIQADKMSSDPYSGFRRSILERIGALEFAREKISEFEKFGFKGIKVYEITDWEEDAPAEEAFLNFVVSEYRDKIEGWKVTLATNIKNEYRVTNRVMISQSLTVNASISTSNNLLSRLLKTPPTIHINLGLILSVEDALGFVLSTKTFFTHRTGDGELTLMNPSFKIGRSHPQRFLNYQKVLNETKGFAQVLTSGIPFAPWRLCQFEMLSDMGIHWVILHEQSHGLLGHLEQAKKHKGRAGKMSLNESDHDEIQWSTTTGRRPKILEMEADSQALSLLYDLIYMNPKAPVVAAYRAHLQNGNYKNNQAGSIIELSTPKDYLRALLLSVSLVIILLENKRLQTNPESSSAYPSPITRLFGLFYTLGIRYLGVEKDSDSQSHSRDDVRVLFGAYMESILDIQLAVSLLDIQNEAFRPFIWEKPDSRVDEFSNDLFTIVSKEITDVSQVKTEAAREFLFLKLYEHKANL